MQDLTQEAFLERIDTAINRLGKSQEYNAFITADPKTIRDSAGDFLEKNSAASNGELAGKIIGIKDNINVSGVPTSCGSHILDNFVAPYNATVIDRITDAGGFIFGKTNMDEFAMGSSNEHSYFGPVKNPNDLTRVPGGSSGGSAAAVKLGIVDTALGSETGGSVRQPAAFCGVVGLKPSYGRVSRYGLVAFASSFDQIAPFGHSVEDVAVLLKVIAGYDPKDSTSLEMPVPDYLRKPWDNVKDLTIGLPSEYFAEGLNPEIESRIKSIASWLESEGATVVEVDLPHAEYSIATYYILTTAEASSNLARYDAMRYGLRQEKTSLEETFQETRSEGFGDEVKRRIMLGTYVLSAGYYDAYYSKAQKVRRLIKSDFDAVYEKVDALITPTTPTTAFELGAKTADPLEMYLSDIYTAPANLTGMPGLNVPIGTDEAGLPIGLQILAKPFNEETILQLGHYIEQRWNSGSN